MLYIGAVPTPDNTPLRTPAMDLDDGKNYGLYEYYCDNPKCDCKEVVMSVHELDQNDEPKQPVATICYKWQSSQKVGKVTTPGDEYQTHLSPMLLAEFKQWVSSDPDLRALLKNNYNRVKEYCTQKKHPPRQATRKIDRNDLCPCGSGRKYKKCCMLGD